MCCLPKGAEFGVTPATGIELKHDEYGRRWLLCEGDPELLFTENETNLERLYAVPNGTHHPKDAINDYVVHGVAEAVNPEAAGTKAAALYEISLAPGQTRTIQLRLVDSESSGPLLGAEFDKVFTQRLQEADEFYADVIPNDHSEDGRNVMRQAIGGVLWSKQFYHYVVRDWLSGDPASPPPPGDRQGGRNSDWSHVYNADVISMPDKWEYPWYAAWDLAFHCLPIALVDSDFAKEQLSLLLR
jgi:hypothetical protein